MKRVAVMSAIVALTALPSATTPMVLKIRPMPNYKDESASGFCGLRKKHNRDRKAMIRRGRR